MSRPKNDADSEWHVVVTAGAHQVSAAENPYEPASLIADDIHRVLTNPEFEGSHDRAGSVMALWLELEDAIDGPPRYARNLAQSDIEQLMRIAAKEWLAMELSAQAVDAYVERWNEWQDLLEARPGRKK